jgi:CRP-like cAMP-binding protein
VVIREGDEPDDFFAIRSGGFEVHSIGEVAGPPRLVNTMGPGDWFGEIGLIEKIPRTATVTTTDAAVVWRIAGDEFLGALELAPAFPGPLNSGITQRLARTHPSRHATSTGDD